MCNSSIRAVYLDFRFVHMATLMTTGLLFAYIVQRLTDAWLSWSEHLGTFFLSFP